ncbi:MAG: diphthine--ammonia ligase [Candidatus Dadabacteria bacterium]|nr:diphthine--ammonia ligase [Candidatus Dadabacteria bacterium]
MRKNILISWSGGKDSSLALYEIQKSRDYEVAALITTITSDYDRVSMHGLRTILLDEQASSLNIPLEKIFISKNASNDEYESRLKEVLLKYKQLGIRDVVFGDLFLEEIKKYREDLLGKIGMECVFPIWKKDTAKLALEFIDAGFKAVTVCVDSKALGEEFAGREFDEHFLDDLPKTIDPCGENGEFHTFTYDGPIFKKPIAHRLGDIVLRDERFYYCDILPGS